MIGSFKSGHGLANMVAQYEALFAVDLDPQQEGRMGVFADSPKDTPVTNSITLLATTTQELAVRCGFI